MRLLPLLHRFSGKRCLMVGAGRIAARRVAALLQAGAVVDVVAVEVQPPLRETVLQHGGSITQRAYRAGDIAAGLDLVVAATDDRGVNRQVAADCRRLGVLVNVVDDAGLCDVAFPSVIDRHPLMITVSSGSASPILSRLLSQRINALIPSGYGRLAGLVGRFRKKVRTAIPQAERRSQFWQRVLQGVVAESVFSGRMEQAERLLERAIRAPDTVRQTGEVYLIGAGPGDPDLLTLRAFRLLQKADVVIHDRLVSDKILHLLDERTELIYAGKQRSRHHVPQEDINALLVKLAQQGKRVARIKGGDPFVFGRGGEEIEQLSAHNIPFQVIPGVTSANGCSCYAGIPLTHRDHAQSVCFVAGQTRDGQLQLNWPQLAAENQTLVFYMGLHSVAEICRQLIRHGLPSAWPIALIEKGTQLDQRVLTATLATMPARVAAENIESPALLIVGSVVSLHDKLAWFDRPAVQ